MPAAQGSPAAKRPSRWLDRTVGIVLGLLLGVGVIVVFVFEGSEQTIDAPRISGVDDAQGPGQPSGGASVPLVRIVDGRPPPGGPVRLEFELGQTARFVVDSDRALTVEVPAYGISRPVEVGRTLVAFEARRRGRHPVVVAASKFEIAILQVARR
ncbi:MAG: hypothetical protein ACRDKV_09695 [Solirubrobacterales bacterium]